MLCLVLIGSASGAAPLDTRGLKVAGAGGAGCALGNVCGDAGAAATTAPFASAVDASGAVATGAACMCGAAAVAGIEGRVSDCLACVGSCCSHGFVAGGFVGEWCGAGTSLPWGCVGLCSGGGGGANGGGGGANGGGGPCGRSTDFGAGASTGPGGTSDLGQGAGGTCRGGSGCRGVLDGRARCSSG